MTNKYLTLLLLATGLNSCSKPFENTEQRSFSVSLDTVRVDSGDEILFLQYFLNVSTLDPSQKFLYNMNVMEQILEKINLETLSLDSLIQLEKEGPNGIGFPSEVIALDDGGFLFSNNYTLSYLDANLQKTKQITLAREEFITEILPPSKTINIQSQGISTDGRFLAGLYDDSGIGQKPDGIVWIDLEKESGKIISTNELDFITENNLVLEIDGQVRGGYSGAVFFESSEDKIIFSPSSKNMLMIYDLAQDSLITKKYESKLTSNE